MLLLLRQDRSPVCGAARAVLQTARHPPDRQAVCLGPQQPVPGVRREGGIGDEHDRRLETLGAVAGQHAHLVARPVGVADQLGAVGAQPVQERLHGRWMAVLEGERLGEKRLDRLGRRRTEPGEQALATAALAEQTGVKLEGRQEVDLRQQLVQALVRLCEGRAVARRLQTLVQAGATTIVGELEQRLLGQAEQRAAQHGGEAQVVLGQQQHVAERDQVHDRDVIGQRQAVGAGDRHVQLLELADQQFLQDAAPRQENHDVAGADRLAGGP